MPVFDISAERSEANARLVAEGMLTLTRDALFDGDEATFLACFWLPQRIATFTGEQMIGTEDDMRAILRQTREHFRQHRITDMIRLVVSTAWEGPDRYRVTHITHLMSGDLRIRAPYPAFSIHERRGAEWRVAASQYAVDDSLGHARALNPHSRAGFEPARPN